MSRFYLVLFTVLLGWAGWHLPVAEAQEPQNHTHEATATTSPSCHVPVQVTEEAERQLGGAFYTGPEVVMNSGNSQPMAGMGNSQPMAGMEGAHKVHETRHGGAFFMAPNKMHHLVGVFSDECGFKLFLFNAFTKPIHVDRFQAFVHVFPESDDEMDIIRFLSPSDDSTVMTAVFGNAVSRPFQIELYVRFPGSDEPQLFNIDVPAVEQ